MISDCTEIYGRKNDLGSSAEMILSQKSAMRPETFENNIIDRPFRPNALPTGVLAHDEARPEYGATYRASIEARKGGK